MSIYLGDVYRPVDREGVRFWGDQSWSQSQVLTPSLFATNWLIGSVPGGGKSVFAHLLLLGVLQDRQAKVVFIDPKTVEALPYMGHPRVSVVDTRAVEDQLAAVKKVAVELDRRKQVAVSSGLRKLEDAPLLALYIDECADVLTKPPGKDTVKLWEELVADLRYLCQQGRAFGVLVILATQKPDASSVPTTIRDLLVCRVGFRCTTREQSDTVMGSGQSSQGFDLSKLPITGPGYGYLLTTRTPQPLFFRASGEFADDRALAAAIEASQ